jgi:hypothetical protein
MRSSENCWSGLHFSFMSFTYHTASSIPTTRHYLVTPVKFLVLVCAQNLHGCHDPCLQSSFTHIVKKFWSPSSFANPESCSPQLHLGATATRMHLPEKGPGIPLWMECKNPRLSPQIAGIKDPPVPKTDTWR